MGPETEALLPVSMDAPVPAAGVHRPVDDGWRVERGVAVQRVPAGPEAMARPGVEGDDPAAPAVAVVDDPVRHGRARGDSPMAGRLPPQPDAAVVCHAESHDAGLVAAARL